MPAVLGIVLLGVGGLLLGGAWSMYQQGGSKPVVACCAALGVLATVGGVMWL